MSIYADGNINVNSLYIKFLYKFFSPEVVSVSLAAFTSEFFILSVPFTQVKDDVPNKVEFVLIHACCEFMKTLHLYCITHNILTFLLYLLYLLYLFIYM